MRDEFTTPFGDSSLSAKLQSALSGVDCRGACAAVLSPELPGGQSTAGLGFSPERTFHIGSVGKALNGLIFSAMVAEGAVSRSASLSDFLPLAGAPVGDVTLEALVNHTSGLPSVGSGRAAALRSLWRLIRKKDPQPEGFSDLMAQLRRARLGTSEFHYSNLGGAALGHALAAADGVSYPQLIAQRIAQPLGCPTLAVLDPDAAEREADVPGLSVYNTAQEPWSGEGYAPAGGIRASAQDMVIVLEAVLDGRLPGQGPGPSQRYSTGVENPNGGEHLVSDGWFIQEAAGNTGELAWHNGAANGFVSAVVLDRAVRRGVFVSLRDGTMDSDPLPVALSLLREV